MLLQNIYLPIEESPFKTQEDVLHPFMVPGLQAIGKYMEPDTKSEQENKCGVCMKIELQYFQR
jgi:hypothetical protein